MIDRIIVYHEDSIYAAALKILDAQKKFREEMTRIKKKVCARCGSDSYCLAVPWDRRTGQASEPHPDCPRTTW